MFVYIVLLDIFFVNNYFYKTVIKLTYIVLHI